MNSRFPIREPLGAGRGAGSVLELTSRGVAYQITYRDDGFTVIDAKR